MSSPYDLEISSQDLLTDYARGVALKVKAETLNELGPLLYVDGTSSDASDCLTIFRENVRFFAPHAIIHELNLMTGQPDEQLDVIMESLVPERTTGLDRAGVFKMFKERMDYLFLFQKQILKNQVLFVVVHDGVESRDLALATELRDLWASHYSPVIAMSTSYSAVVQLKRRSETRRYGDVVRYKPL